MSYYLRRTLIMTKQIHHGIYLLKWFHKANEQQADHKPNNDFDAKPQWCFN